jgi:hypothetical protein
VCDLPLTHPKKTHLAPIVKQGHGAPGAAVLHQDVDELARSHEVRNLGEHETKGAAASPLSGEELFAATTEN